MTHIPRILITCQLFKNEIMWAEDVACSMLKNNQFDHIIIKLCKVKLSLLWKPFQFENGFKSSEMMNGTETSFYNINIYTFKTIITLLEKKNVNFLNNIDSPK